MKTKRMEMDEKGLIFKEREIIEEKDPPPDPDPGLRVAEFIAWLKKRGYIWSYRKCERKCIHLGLDLEKDVVEELGPEIIRKYRSRGGILLKIENRTWAHDIVQYHGVDIPHHRHHQPW